MGTSQDSQNCSVDDVIKVKASAGDKNLCLSVEKLNKSEVNLTLTNLDRHERLFLSTPFLRTANSLIKVILYRGSGHTGHKMGHYYFFSNKAKAKSGVLAFLQVGVISMALSYT